MSGAKKGLDLIKTVASYMAKSDGYDKFISKVNYYTQAVRIGTLTFAHNLYI